MKKNKFDKKLSELKESDLENLKLILEIKARTWDVGRRKLLLIILPTLVTILTLVAGYIYDRSKQRTADEMVREQERYEFLSSLLLESESQKQTKFYAIEELKKNFLEKSTDILKVVSEEDDKIEVREKAVKVYLESLDTLLSSGKIDSSSHFERYGSVSLIDTLLRPDDSILDEKESWWLYLGNYNREKEYWVPQSRLLGYTTSIPISTIKLKPDDLKGVTSKSIRNVNLRKTYSTSAKVEKKLVPGQMVEIITVEKIERHKISSTDRVWVEIIIKKS